MLLDTMLELALPSPQLVSRLGSSYRDCDNGWLAVGTTTPFVPTASTGSANIPPAAFSRPGFPCSITGFSYIASTEWQEGLDPIYACGFNWPEYFSSSIWTELSKPYQRDIPPDKLCTPETSAEKLMDILDSLTPDDTGKFFSYTKQEIPW
ncbi:hypothetical protein L7F22_037763 [Adiantum nelumboides]|nr:hypothetical protein [Adiantum nelumboides]